MTELPLDDAWIPTPEFIKNTNIAWLMEVAHVTTYEEVHRWSVEERAYFWQLMIGALGIRFRREYEMSSTDCSPGIKAPRWLVGALLNIVESCFQNPTESPAIIHQTEGGPLNTMTVGELSSLTRRVAANLSRIGIRPGDAVAIFMPMTAECVAIYLGIIYAGCAVVGIAESFQPKEIATRLRISGAQAVFTRDFLIRGGKTLPLYPHLVEAGAPRAIVLSRTEIDGIALREGDLPWSQFLEPIELAAAVACNPDEKIGILFSSGTTRDPKAIPWTHATPIKCATDAYFHQNVNRGDVLVWPTSIGWMMGPWLIFASLLNRAAMGLYDGVPTTRDFGDFVHSCGATMLGVVPSLVKAWRRSGCMDACDWTGLKLFSSTGECSNIDDMRWLMARAGGRPVIEYCGGTEIAGAYITGTLTRPCLPGYFNTPALGLDIVILDEAVKPSNSREVFLVPPSLGLSDSLLNDDHDRIYFAGTPRGPHGEVLRRHGDQMEALPGGYWRGQGRADDTMNLGGIKVSSAEIERVLQAVPGVIETAAIAVSACGGPSALVVYAVCSAAFSGDRSALLAAMQSAIRSELNPLFKIHDLVLIETLPRTASNKVMRRVLRDRYAPDR